MPKGGLTKAQGFTKPKKEQFLKCLRECGNVGKAAEAIGYSRRACYHHREKDPEFAAAWDDAQEHVTDRLEEECIRRAEGYMEDIVYQGKVHGQVKKHSDILCMFLLKGRRPERYRERYEISGSAKRPLRVQEIKTAALEAYISNGIAEAVESGN